MSTRRMLFLILFAALGMSVPSFGQEIVKDALEAFPVGTIRIEYSSLAVLRKLPNYEDLRQHYTGPRLKELETSLARLGVKESDVNELVLGWDPEGSSADFFGLATGNFNPKALQARAAERHIAPETIGGATGYCLGAGLETPCIVLLSAKEGAFGTLNFLSQVMETMNGARPALKTDGSFVKIVDQAQKTATIWGVAAGEAVPDWFKGWMPTQRDIQLDWTQVFQNVDDLAYSVDAGGNVRLHMTLYCKTDEAAASLRQVLEGLKLAQQLAWQTQNPNQPNPFLDMALGLNGSQVSVGLTASYGELSAAAPKGSTLQ